MRAAPAARTSDLGHREEGNDLEAGVAAERDQDEPHAAVARQQPDSERALHALPQPDNRAGGSQGQVGRERGNRREYSRTVEAAYVAPILCVKRVVAKIRGICMGGGLGLAAACDVRFASDDAVFRMPAARLGLGYSFTGMRPFVQVLGAANTADIFFSARKFDARDALATGLVSRVVPAADLDREVAACCALIAENAPLSLIAAIREVLADPATRDLAALQKLIDACFASGDYREGRTAFMEKREPAFKGR